MRKDRPGRTSDGIVRHFAGQIDSGALSEGSMLPSERELAEKYGVSRTVIREAVQTLAMRGLVEARPRHRPVVRRPGFDAAFESVNEVVGRLLLQPEGLWNLFRTRIMIEVSLVRLAALDASKDDLTALKEALSANKEAIGESERFYRTDANFHAKLYAIPQNPVLPAVHRAYTVWLWPHWSKMPPSIERNRKNFDDHAEIFDMIVMRDPDAAERALQRHLNKAWRHVRDTVLKLREQ